MKECIEMSPLSLKDYSSLIKLDEVFFPHKMMQSNNEKLIDDLIDVLLREPNAPGHVEIPNDYKAKRNFLRALLNIRAPKPLDDPFLEKVDTLLQIELKEKGI